MAIDVGPSCIDRGSASSSGFTHVLNDNPANATGTIDYICAYIVNGGTNFEVASFADEGSNTLSTNGVSGDLGATSNATKEEWNAPGDFTAFSINSGEYLGFYSSDATVEMDSSGGGGMWYDTRGDYIPCSSHTFEGFVSDYAISCYATGTEAGGAGAPTGALYGPLVGPFGGPMGPMGGRL